jgi:DNA-binding MarR family transcriptional regulator
MKNKISVTPAESIVCLAHRFESIANKYVFKPMGLSSSTMHILKLLKIHKELTASDIIEILNATKSNISQRLNFLEKEGHIQRVYAADKKDKRKITISLTNQGKEVIRNLENRFQKAQIKLEEEFTKKELEQHKNFITKINGILDKGEIELEKLFKL